MANAGFDATIGPSATSGAGSSEWNAGTVNALGSGLALVGNTLAAALQWQAGNVGALGGPGISLFGTTLEVEWNGGTVNALGSGMTLTAGTLSAGGGGAAGNSQVVTVAPFTRPALTSFTWRNQSTSTATDHANGPIGLISTENDGQLHGLEIAVPGSTPWTFTAQIDMAFANQSAQAGIYITDGTKLITFDRLTSSDGNEIFISKYNSVSSFSGNYNNDYCVIDKVWLRIHNSGTNYTFFFSPNGADWVQWYSAAVTDFLGTVTAAGFYNNGAPSNAVIVALNAWELATGAGSTATFQAAY